MSKLNVVCSAGLPGFGKSVLADVMVRSAGAVRFHAGYFFKHLGEYAAYIQEKEMAFLRKVVEDGTAAEARAEGRCIFAQGEYDTDVLLARVALDYGQASGKDTLYMDAFPRTPGQALALTEECRRRGIIPLLYVIEAPVLGTQEVKDAFSFARQLARDEKKYGHMDLSLAGRYAGKIRTYHEQTEQAIRVMTESGADVRRVRLDGHGRLMLPYIPFNRVYDPATGDTHYCSEYFTYPCNEEDYTKVFSSYREAGGTLPERLPGPVMATVTLANYCPDRCGGCFNCRLTDRKELSMEALDRLLEGLAAEGCRSVKAAGREPSAYGLFGHFLEKAESVGLKTAVIMSGAQISRWEDVLKGHCDHLRVSLNAATPELHEKIHHPTEDADDFGVRVETLRRIIPARRRNGLITGVSYLIRGEETKEQFPLFVEMCREIGVDYVRFSALNYFNGSAVSEEYISQMQALGRNGMAVRYHSQFEEEEGMDTDVPASLSCPALASRVVIHADGSVVSCHCAADLEKSGLDPVFGNVNTHDFHEIWQGRAHRRFLAQAQGRMQENRMKSGEYAACGSCSTCKYSGFNAIQRWAAMHGNVREEFYGSDEHVAAIRK